MSKIDPANYLHFVWGENNISSQIQQTYIIKLDHPSVSIRFDYSKGIFACYDDFYNNIADVQFFTGERPSDVEVEKILNDAWNFMVLEEQKLDDDLEWMEEEDDRY